MLSADDQQSKDDVRGQLAHAHVTGGGARTRADTAAHARGEQGVGSHAFPDSLLTRDPVLLGYNEGTGDE